MGNGNRQGRRKKMRSLKNMMQCMCSGEQLRREGSMDEMAVPSSSDSLEYLAFIGIFHIELRNRDRLKN
ncbi:hypothetical protein HN51_054458, partial [Arachis hypogaea]